MEMAILASTATMRRVSRSGICSGPKRGRAVVAVAREPGRTVQLDGRTGVDDPTGAASVPRCPRRAPPRGALDAASQAGRPGDDGRPALIAGPALQLSPRRTGLIQVVPRVSALAPGCGDVDGRGGKGRTAVAGCHCTELAIRVDATLNNVALVIHLARSGCLCGSARVGVARELDATDVSPTIGRR
jgi:hypothetical protein